MPRTWSPAEQEACLWQKWGGQLKGTRRRILPFNIFNLLDDVNFHCEQFFIITVKQIRKCIYVRHGKYILGKIIEKDSSKQRCYILEFSPILFCFVLATPVHEEVPRPEIKPAPQLRSKPQQWQCWILNLLRHQGTPEFPGSKIIHLKNYFPSSFEYIALNVTKEGSELVVWFEDSCHIQTHWFFWELPTFLMI